jgi:hypothetical protein
MPCSSDTRVALLDAAALSLCAARELSHAIPCLSSASTKDLLRLSHVNLGLCAAAAAARTITPGSRSSPSGRFLPLPRALFTGLDAATARHAGHGGKRPSNDQRTRQTLGDVTGKATVRASS